MNIGDVSARVIGGNVWVSKLQGVRCEGCGRPWPYSPPLEEIEQHGEVCLGPIAYSYDGGVVRMGGDA